MVPLQRAGQGVRAFPTSRPLEEWIWWDKVIPSGETYELTRREDVPPRVVINEGSSWLKLHSPPNDSHKFVNGVLDSRIKDAAQALILLSVSN